MKEKENEKTEKKKKRSNTEKKRGNPEWWRICSPVDLILQWLINFPTNVLKQILCPEGIVINSFFTLNNVVFLKGSHLTTSIDGFFKIFWHFAYVLPSNVTTSKY